MRLSKYVFLDTDCSVSSWSPWSDNIEFGQKSRIRTIIQHPSGNGEKCPTNLEEIRYTGKAPDVNVTAAKVTEFFIRPNGQNDDATTDQVRDLLLIMDSSGSVGSTAFHEANFQLSRLLGLLCPKGPFDSKDSPINQCNKAAMLTFSYRAYLTFGFDYYKTTRYVQNAISAARYHGGGINTADAFEQARQMLERGAGVRGKDQAKREVLILTDGQSNSRAQTLAAVAKLKGTAAVFGLMTGRFSQQGMDELTQYVSSPINQHLFFVENY